MPLFVPEIFLTSQIQQWASRQLADYDAHQPGKLFAEGVVLDVAQGYELQSAVSQLRCARGDQVIGYKVGCTSKKIRKQLGIDHCITGRLYDCEQHASGTELSRSKFANLAIEGELAIELSREPSDNDFSQTEIPTCVCRVFPAIELHHHVMRGATPTAGELVANNAIHAGFVAGRGVTSQEIRNKSSLESATLAIFSNGEQLEHCAGRVLIQTIHTSLKWLTEVVNQRGDRLHGGQIILTGSIPSLIPVTENCRIAVDAPPFGSVDAVFNT